MRDLAPSAQSPVRGIAPPVRDSRIRGAFRGVTDRAVESPQCAPRRARGTRTARQHGAAVVHPMQQPPGMKSLVTSTATLLLICGACSERAEFQPTQNPSSVSPSGQPAASYDLRADQTSDAKITVNVWSDGARRIDDHTIVDAGIELRNAGAEPVELDREALALDSFDQRGAPLPPARLVGVKAEKGSDVVAPRSASIFWARFELGAPIAPSHLGALRLRWGVVRDNHDRYVQFTDFRRQPEYAPSTTVVYYDPIFGYYDPFFYGPPFGYHFNYYVPVGHVIVDHRDRRPPRR